MEIKATEIKVVPIGSIVPNPKNPNIHTEAQIERLANIIRYQGMRNPLTVSNRSGFLVTGHGRLEACKRIGMEEIPVIFQDFDNEAQEYAHVVADNAIGEWAILDVSKINAEFIDLGPELDIEMLGLKNFSIDPINLDMPAEEEAIKKHIIEVQFPNVMELADVRDDLLSRGYIVRER